jgi:ParB-like chromosome segregation protein Spo0J
VKDGMKYRILDGNHRFMALKLKFDVKEVPCIVVGEMGKDYDEIRFWQEAIRTNNIKGEFNVDVLIQRAMWIYDKVRNKYDLNELRKRLGFTSKDDSFKQVLKTIESTLPAEAREKFREYSKKIKNPIELPKAIDKALKETYTNTDIQDRKQLMFVSEEQDRVVVMCDEELWHLVQELVLYIKNKGGDARNLFKMIIRNWLDGERHGKE